jgi:glycosyltransferase involved in cell wall biosynthesis
MRKGVRVAIISSSVDETPEGVIRPFIFDEAYRLVKRGVEVHVIRSKMEEERVSYGIHFHGLIKGRDHTLIPYKFLARITGYPPISLVRRPAALSWENLYALSVSKVVRKRNVDLIHAHFAYPEGLIGLLAKRKDRKPLLITVHGYDLNVSKEYHYGIRLQPRYNFIIRKVLTEADCVIVPSKLLYLRALEVGVKRSNISFLPHGVDLTIFKPNLNGSIFREKYSLGDEPIVLTIRKLRPISNIEEVIKVAKMMPESVKAKFVIIGGGSRSQLIKLTELAGNLINKRIYFLGWVPHAEIPYAIASATLLLDPCPVGQGINVLEAMACAKPTIAISSRGLWDYVVDGKTGFLVKMGETRTIVEKIVYLLQNEEEAKILGRNGRKVVEEKHDANKRIDRIISLYEKLLKNA